MLNFLRCGVAHAKCSNAPRSKMQFPENGRLLQETQKPSLAHTQEIYTGMERCQQHCVEHLAGIDVYRPSRCDGVFAVRAKACIVWGRASYKYVNVFGSRHCNFII